MCVPAFVCESGGMRINMSSRVQQRHTNRTAYSRSISTHNHLLRVAETFAVAHTLTLHGLPSVLTSQAVLAAPQAWDAINDSHTQTHIYTLTHANKVQANKPRGHNNWQKTNIATTILSVWELDVKFKCGLCASGMKKYCEANFTILFYLDQLLNVVSCSQ